jgi:uncharacterized membrane protein
VIAIAAATLAFFWPMIRPFGQRMYVVAGDFSNQFYPLRVFEGQEWWSRRIPLWNPYVYGGHPFQADVQTAVFYPPALLNAIAWGKSGLPYVALEGEIVVHTFLAVAFMYALARKVTGNVWGSLIAGVAFGLGGFVTSYPAQQLAILETIVWLPLVVLTLELALESPINWRWLLAASASFGVAILAGHPQTDLFIAYAVEGYLLFRLVRARVRPIQALGALLLFPALAVGVAAIQILPTLEFFTQSMRVRMDFASAAHGYLLSAIWQVFVPLWHGEKALSIGVVALVFAAIGAVASRREPLGYWTIAGLVSIPLSTGGATPLFSLLYVAAPGWNLFRDQERVICVFSFAAALLAARGFAAIEDKLTGQSWQRAAMAIAASGALASTAAFGLAGGVVGDAAGLRSSLAVNAFALAVLAVFVFARRRNSVRVAPQSALIVLLVAAEAFAINHGNNLGPSSPDPRPRLAATTAYMRGFPEPFRVKALNEALFPSDYGAVLGTPMITGDTPFTTQRADEMLTSNPDYKVWQLLNLKFFVTDGGPLGGLQPVFHDGSLTTYLLVDSLPRAWAVTAYEVARDSTEARAMILAPPYHPGNVVVLEQPPAIGPIAPGPRPDVKLTHLDPQRVALDANAAQNSMLVLADAYYPGWNAYRDGTPVPVYRANYLTMAFDLPAGLHHFEIVYQPWSFYLGATITLGCLALLLIVAQRSLGQIGAWPRRSISLSRLVPVLWAGSVAAIVAGALALRLHALADPNLTGDEWFMLRNHDEGLAWIVHQAHTFEPHPLLYYVGLAGWIDLAGRSEFAMRFPSVAFGVLLAAAMIRLGRDLTGWRAGLIAGVLAAINPYQIAESQNARNYEMVAAASAVASALFIRALRRGQARDWFAYAAAMLVALNVHYDAALVLATHVAFVIVVWSVPRALRPSGLIALNLAPHGLHQRRWLLATGVAVLGFGLWLLYALPALAAYHGYFPKPVTIDYVLVRSLATFSLGALAAIRQAIPIFALAALGLAWLLVRRRATGIFLGLYNVLPIVAVSIILLIRPMYDERYLIVLAPGYLLLVASGVDAVLHRYLWPVGVVCGVALVALTAPMVRTTYASALTDRPDYRSMARWVSAHGAPDDPIIATGHGQAELFGYYYHGTTPIEVVDDPARLGSAEALTGTHPGLWLLPFFHSDADIAALATLDRGAVPVAEHWFQNSRALYFGSAARLQPTTVPQASWNRILTLTAISIAPSSLKAGEAVDLELGWTVSAPLTTPKLSLRLLDSSGSLVAQSDVPLASTDQLVPGHPTTRLGDFVPPAAAPGKYTLTLLPYEATSGKPLDLSSDAAQLAGGLVLATVEVTASDRPVAAEETGVELTNTTTFPASLTLLGHDPLPNQSVPGSTLQFRALWRADRTGGSDLSRVTELRDKAGKVVATTSGLIAPTWPTSKWSLGSLLAERVSFKVPATLNTGTYFLSLRVDGSSPMASIGMLTVQGPDRVLTEPKQGERIGARFDPFATLARAEVASPQAAPNGAYRVTLVWQARATADRPYTVFVHVVNDQGRIITQADRPPGAGQRPTDGWVGGEYIVDTYELSVPSSTLPGQFWFQVGLYDQTTGARVPVTLPAGTTSDHVVIGGFVFKP